MGRRSVFQPIRDFLHQILDFFEVVQPAVIFFAFFVIRFLRFHFSVEFLQIGMKGRRPAGLVQVDPDRPGGYISFLYLVPRERGNNVGVQLLGKAISVLRPMDRDVLRLVCSEMASAFLLPPNFRKRLFLTTRATTSCNCMWCLPQATMAAVRSTQW